MRRKGTARGDAAKDSTVNAAPTVSGVVADTSGAPLAGVAVSIGATTVTTSATGAFSLTTVPAMDATVLFRKTGYAGRTLT